MLPSSHENTAFGPLHKDAEPARSSMFGSRRPQLEVNIASCSASIEVKGDSKINCEIPETYVTITTPTCKLTTCAMCQQALESALVQGNVHLCALIHEDKLLRIRGRGRGHWPLFRRCWGFAFEALLLVMLKSAEAKGPAASWPWTASCQGSHYATPHCA